MRVDVLKRRRANVFHVPQCPKCHLEGRRRGYCLKCHAAYMRKWRKTHPMNQEQRRKANARCYAGVYARRGLLERKPCEVCGTLENLERHHDDYSKPLQVRWHCRKHHLEIGELNHGITS